MDRSSAGLQENYIFWLTKLPKSPWRSGRRTLKSLSLYIKELNWFCGFIEGRKKYQDIIEAKANLMIRLFIHNVVRIFVAASILNFLVGTNEHRRSLSTVMVMASRIRYIFSDVLNFFLSSLVYFQFQLRFESFVMQYRLSCDNHLRFNPLCPTSYPSQRRERWNFNWLSDKSYIINSKDWEKVLR